MRKLTISIKAVQTSDYEGMALFFADNNRPEITRHFHPFPLDADSAYQITCMDKLNRYYLAMHGGHIVGFCMLRGWDEGFAIPSFGVLVDYRYQGRGLGRQLTEFALEEAKRLNSPAVRLSVYESNIRARRLYEMLGFAEVSREPVTITGEPDTKIVMIKYLS